MTAEKKQQKKTTQQLVFHIKAKSFHCFVSLSSRVLLIKEHGGNSDVGPEWRGGGREVKESRGEERERKKEEEEEEGGEKSTVEQSKVEQRAGEEKRGKKRK